MTWLWISAPIAAVLFLAYTVIPIWLGYRRPDTGPAEAVRSGNAVPEAVPARHGARRAAAEPRSSVVPQAWLQTARR